jgi:short-subunit dehydrogenase
MKLYLNDMVKRDSGYILNVASIAGFMPGPLMSAYYATKNYVVSLSEGVREELKHKKSKVRLGILCPGPVKTNFDNIAGVKFSLKGKSSDNIARYAIKMLEKGNFYIVPGIDIKLLRFVGGIVPNSLVSKVVYYQQRKKNNN